MNIKTRGFRIEVHEVIRTLRDSVELDPEMLYSEF